MAIYSFFDQKIGLGNVCGKWITDKINELGGEATQNTSDKSILISKFGSIENEIVYYPSSTVSSSYAENPYFDAIISDTTGREFFLIICKQLGSSAILKGTTAQNISFFFFKDATGKLNWLVSSLAGATNYSYMEFYSSFGVPRIVLSTPASDSALDLEKQNSVNKLTSTTGTGYNYAERLLHGCDISNLFLYTSSYSIAPQTVYTDDAGVEYIGIHELLAVRKDKYVE